MTDYPPPGGYPLPGDQPPPGGYPPQGGYPAGAQPPPGGYPPPSGYPQPGGYPPGGFQPPMGYAPGAAPKLRPGRIWYLVALLVFAAGLAWLIYSIFAFANTVDGLQRVPLPAGGTVHLGHSGGYVVYYEGPGAQSGNIQSFNVHIIPASAGASASLHQYGSQVTYNVGSHHGRAVLALNVSQPGAYRVAIVGTPSAGSDLAIGGSIARGVVGILIPALPVMVLAFVGGLVVFIIRIVRKSSMRRAGGP